MGKGINWWGGVEIGVGGRDRVWYLKSRFSGGS